MPRATWGPVFRPARPGDAIPHTARSAEEKPRADLPAQMTGGQEGPPLIRALPMRVMAEGSTGTTGSPRLRGCMTDDAALCTRQCFRSLTGTREEF